MTQQTSGTIYQSGEKVPLAGLYEVVGSKPTGKKTTGEFVVRDLRPSEKFPCYEGYVVAWHLLKPSLPG